LTAFKYNSGQAKAREVLASDARHIALGGGARSGKSLLLLDTTIARALRAEGSRHVVFRFRFNALKTSVVLDTFPKLMKMKYEGLYEAGKLDKTDWYFRFHNESELWFCGLDDKDRVEKVLGMEFATMFFNECSQIPYHSVETAQSRLAQKTGLKLRSYYDFNPPGKAHWTYKTFIEKKSPEDNQPFPDPFNYAFYRINPDQNKDNISPEFLEHLKSRPEKYRKRFLYGEFADDQDGYLWTDSVLASTRKLGQVGDELPEFIRVVVAVDPSGCDGDPDTRSDEIGITVVALGQDRHGYLLEDLSLKAKPEKWGQIAVDAYKRHGADAIIGETNFGGDMVRMVIHSIDSAVNFKSTHAARGKTVRAQPISSLYEQNRIHHVGYFPELEEQLCGMTVNEYQGIRSPDRADSAIHGFHEIFGEMTRENSRDIIPQIKTASRSAARFGKR
jgi:hypothetical protein